MKNLKTNFKNFNFRAYSNQLLPKNNVLYIYFAAAVFATSLTAVKIDADIYVVHKYLVNISQATSFLIATFFLSLGLMSREILGKYLGPVWIVSIFLTLAFISPLLVIASKFSHTSLIVLTLHLTIIPMLIGWRPSIIFITLGIGLSYSIYQIFIHDYMTNDIVDLKMKLGYIIVLAIGLTATFLKNFQEEKETAESSSFELKTQVNELENATKDLSDKVEYFDQRVKDQAAEIERLGATSQRILNNVNHELRLPVGNVMNFTEMLNESLDTYEEKHIKMLTEEVYKNSTRLSTMILNMLDLATLEVNDIKLELQDLNLVSLIKERVETCKKIYLDGKNINFAFDMPTSLNYKCDANYFRQIVDNLVINSIKHSKEGLVKIRLLQDQKWIKIIIEDQGDGIPKEDLFDIFTPFRIGVKHQTPAEGRGVGLALCKSALEAHGGTITANSEGGKGAKFTIILPVQ